MRDHREWEMKAILSGDPCSEKMKASLVIVQPPANTGLSLPLSELAFVCRSWLGKSPTVLQYLVGQWEHLNILSGI